MSTPKGGYNLITVTLVMTLYYLYKVEKDEARKKVVFSALLISGYLASWIIIGIVSGFSNFSFHILHTMLLIYAVEKRESYTGYFIFSASMLVCLFSLYLYGVDRLDLMLYVIMVTVGVFYSIHLVSLLESKKSLQKKVDELETLYAIQKVMDSFPDIDTAISQITRIVTFGIDVDLCAVLLYSEEKGALELRGQYSATQLEDALRPEFGLAEDVFKTGVPIVCHDLNQDSGLLQRIDFKHEDDAIGILPLEHDDIRYGVILFTKRDSMEIDSGILQVVAGVASSVAMVLSNTLYHTSVLRRSQRDDLSGLFNRSYFFEALETEIRKAQITEQSVHVLLLDIDKFKLINDTYGHLIGDKVIEEVGRILKENTRKSDVATRYGGEEFAVVLPNSCYSAAEHIAERIRISVEKITLQVPDLSLIEDMITLSLGIACYPHCGLDSREIVDIADKRMYAAKRTGGNQYIYK
jgi:diguanylate cyclase (GGDEF)-like protein